MVSFRDGKEAAAREAGTIIVPGVGYIHGVRKRYIHRDAGGRIEESDDVSRSLSQDRRRKANATKPGQEIAATACPAAKNSARKKTRAKR
jgi:hypothetical protein